jgi:Zn-finger nucleic acid-binding protein
MKCRRCETSALDEREGDGVTIDVCPQCRGLWLDRAEQERLHARAVECEDVPDRPNAPEQDDDDHARHVARRYHEKRPDQEDRGYAAARGRKRRRYESLTTIFD